MRAGALASLLALTALAGGAGGAAAAGYSWRLPEGFPEPLVPADNPMSAEKVEAGRRLFYDPRLSVNGARACASCHRQELAFTDGRARAVGATGQVHPRSAMSLTNVAYNASFTWMARGPGSLERQLRMPLLGRRPVELGLAGAERRLERELAADGEVARRFAAAFPCDPRPVRMANVERALASFERTLISGDSAYDRLLFRGDGDALSAAAKRGMELFFSARLACARCHAGFNLSGPIVFRGSPRAAPAFHRTSLPGAPAGIRQAGAFRAPTLRNIAVTGPYLRDGSLATLGEVVDAYASGRRGGNARGQESALLRGFSLAPGEREALIAFLEALTDAAFLSDPRFGPPMEGARR